MRVETWRDETLRERASDEATRAAAEAQARRDVEVARRRIAAGAGDATTDALILARELGRLGRYVGLEAGRSEEAMDALEEAVALFDRHGKASAAVMTRLHMAEALAGAGRGLGAGAICSELLREIVRDGRLVYEPFILITRAAARMAQGDRIGASEDLAAAAMGFYINGKDAKGDEVVAWAEALAPSADPAG